jgi:hypothetical protein
MRLAYERLGASFGAALAINVKWDDTGERPSSKSGVETFGNGIRHITRLAIIGLVLLALPVFLLGLITGFANDGLSAGRLRQFILVCMLLWAVLPVVVLPTCLLSVRVASGEITHLLFGFLVLSRHQVSDLTSIEVAKKENKPFGLVLRFRTGRALRSFGMHLRIIQCLCQHLHEIAPHPFAIHWGVVSAPSGQAK